MTTSRPCPSCGGGLEPGDRFCPSCGRAADIAQPTGDPHRAGNPAEDLKTCPMCGQKNPQPAATCSSCGAKIGDAVRQNEGTAGARKIPEGIGTFQSWKFTLGVAAALVTVLVFIVSSGQTPEPVKTPEDPHDAGMMQRIRELQAHIEEHPADPDALLEFANLLYDVQFFQRAAEMYERHLALVPANADARVDLGTSYFQMSFADSARGTELVSMAEQCFLKAIEVKPKHQLAHFNLGIIHLHRGDMTESGEWLRKSVDIDPGTEAAGRARQLLAQHIQNKPS